MTMYAEAADMGNVTAHMMLSTRDINTIYKGSMSKILGREDNTTTMYDGVDMETLVMEQRPGSPQDNFKIPNATSQYVKGKDLKYQSNNSNYQNKSGKNKIEFGRDDYQDELEFIQ